MNKTSSRKNHPAGGIQLFKRLTLGVALTSLLSLCLPPQAADACSFDQRPYFTYTNHPDLPLDKYAAGQLGILQAGYARSYLLVAYKYLSGGSLSEEEKKGAVSLWNARLANDMYGCNADTASWLKARATVPGAKKIESIDIERPTAPKAYNTYCNCQTPAFVTAAKTLKQLTDKYGAGSAQVKEWLAAQDEVFSDCGYPTYSDKPHADVIPKPLEGSADPILKQHRAYQIASANFYAQNFDVAIKEFEQIAADNSSPWQQLSGYLAARAMIRKATLPEKVDNNELKRADEKLKLLEADHSYQSLHDDIADLRSFIAVRLTPAEHLARLVKEKLTQKNLDEITSTVDGLTGQGDDSGSESVSDYSKMPDALKKFEELDWVLTMQATDKTATRHAIEKWKQTHSIPWLVAAAISVDSDDPAAATIADAAGKVHSGPAQYTLFYNANRINIGKGNKDDAVRAALDKMLGSPPADLPAGSLNQLRTQRLILANNLAEFVKFAVQTPLTICTNGGVEQVPDDMEDIIKGKIKTEKPEFTFDAGTVLEKKLPLSILRQLSDNKSLPTDLRNNLGFTSFVRAILIGDDTNARAIAQSVKGLNKKREPLFNTYLQATDPQSRKFAAAMIMLHYSSAQPCATSGQLLEDGYGDASGWWWTKPSIPEMQSGEVSDQSEADIDPEFLTDAQTKQAAAEVARLKKVDSAPNYLTRIVLEYARSHPNDPRVPEALHLAVKCTRYGGTDDATQPLSKQAFNLLHKNYKSSTWTKQTPYFY